jgi:hypothetical protein
VRQCAAVRAVWGSAAVRGGAPASCSAAVRQQCERQCVAVCTVVCGSALGNRRVWQLARQCAAVRQCAAMCRSLRQCPSNLWVRLCASVYGSAHSSV